MDTANYLWIRGSSQSTESWRDFVIGTTSEGIIHYKVTQLSGPSVLAISWAGKYRKFFRAPNAIHRSVMLRRWSDVTSRSTTPVWTVRMSILSPSIFQVEYRLYRGWLHGARSCISRSTSTWYVLTACVSVAVVAALVAKYENTVSCCCQCRGTPDPRHSFGWLYALVGTFPLFSIIFNVRFPLRCSLKCYVVELQLTSRAI